MRLKGVSCYARSNYRRHCTVEYGGSNAYPDNWNELLRFFGIDREEDEENE